MNNERLLNVAKALRESPKPRDFSMGRYVNHCGTPACAFGHYASRNDLQQFCKFDQISIVSFDDEDSLVDYDDPETCEHFGVTRDESILIFREDGCGRAKTAVEAAEFIENFVATRSR